MLCTRLEVKVESPIEGRRLLHSTHRFSIDRRNLKYSTPNYKLIELILKRKGYCTLLIDLV